MKIFYCQNSQQNKILKSIILKYYFSFIVAKYLKVRYKNLNSTNRVPPFFLAKLTNGVGPFFWKSKNLFHFYEWNFRKLALCISFLCGTPLESTTNPLLPHLHKLIFYSYLTLSLNYIFSSNAVCAFISTCYAICCQA